MPIEINITDQQLQSSFETALNKMMTDGSWSNPVNRVLDDVIGYSSKHEAKEQIKQKVEEYVKNKLGTPEFDLLLGQAIAARMAKEAIDKIKK